MVKHSTTNAWGFTEADFERVGVKQDVIEPWEDGHRVAGLDKRAFEWWYFDMHMEDNTVVAVVASPFSEFASFGYHRNKPVLHVAIVPSSPSGVDPRDLSKVKILAKEKHYDPSDVFFSTEKTDIAMGTNYIKGDLINYKLFVDVDTMVVDVNLKRILNSYRPGNGFVFLNENEYFGWIVSIPYGKVEGEITYEGKTHKVKGSCYHDKNFGNVPFPHAMSNWWWGRGEISNHTILAADWRPRGSNVSAPSLLLTNNMTGEIIIDSHSSNEIFVEESKYQEHFDSKYNGKIHHNVRYLYRKGEDKLELTFEAIAPLYSANAFTTPTMLESGQVEYAKNMGINKCWYTRFLAETCISYMVKGKTDTFKGHTILERMET